MIEVTVFDPKQVAKKYSFNQGSVMIGRADGNDVVLECDDVSRYHARLTASDGRVVIQDLDSTNGVFLNLKKVTEAVVWPEDKVMLGEFILTVKYQESGEEEEEEEDYEKFEKEIPKQLPSLEQKRRSAETQNKAVSAAEMCLDTETTEPNVGFDVFSWENLNIFLEPVQEYIEDSSISEVMINSLDEIYIARRGNIEKVEASFSEHQLQLAVSCIVRYAGAEQEEGKPFVDAKLPDGTRIGILFPPYSRKGVSLYIRKVYPEKLTLNKLLQFGTLSPEMVMFIEACVLLRKNILISGAPNSGKSTLLNVVSGLIPGDERLVTIEDSRELELMQEHILPIDISPADYKGKVEPGILGISLGMRPDRIICGELHQAQVLDLLQTMNSGSSALLTTILADSPLQAFSRLEALALSSGVTWSIPSLRGQLSSAFDIVIQLTRFPDHSRKVTHISAVSPITNSAEYRINDIFRFKPQGATVGRINGIHVRTGFSPDFVEELRISGLSDVADLFN